MPDKTCLGPWKMFRAWTAESANLAMESARLCERLRFEFLKSFMPDFPGNLKNAFLDELLKSLKEFSAAAQRHT